MYRFSFMFHLSCPGHVFCPVRSAAEQAIIAFSQSNLLQEAQPVDKERMLG